jgi:MtN3 and saliva related transmembrane protein
MQYVEIIGALAAFTSTVSLLPQIRKVLITKSAEDLSYLMLLNFFITSVLWFWYGLEIGSYSVWICNLFMTLTALLLIALKKRYT